jgi:outer membrane protein, multidrug efflux system
VSARRLRPGSPWIAQFAATLVAATVGCAIGPDYRRPELPTPNAFRDQSEGSASFADLPWWEVFRDDALVALIHESLANNRDLAIAAANVEQARYLAAVPRSTFFPQLGYEADATRGKDTVLGSAGSVERGTENDFIAAANLAWEIDVWSRIRRASEAARAELFASEAFRRAVVLSLVSGVAQAWFELLELDRELAIAQESVASYQQTRDLFQRQFAGGVTSKLDVLRAEAALAQAGATAADLERQIVAKENQLSVLIGRPAGEIARGGALAAQSTPPEVPAGVPSQLLERRPDLIEAEQTLVAANAREGQALADYFPRIGLTALAGSVSTELDDLLSSGTGFWSIGASAAGRLFTFGQTTYTWKATQAASDASRAAYQGAVLEALREVSDELTAREKLVTVRAEQERTVTALRESVEMSQKRYVGGLSTYFEVLDAQQELYPAAFELARTERDQLLAVVRLYRALGGGWNTYEETPRVPLPIVP